MLSEVCPAKNSTLPLPPKPSDLNPRIQNLILNPKPAITVFGMTRDCILKLRVPLQSFFLFQNTIPGDLKDKPH